jgi:hypothetical protein
LSGPGKPTAPQRIRVFISHANGDIAVARAVQAHVETELDMKGQVFLSSDPAHIGGGDVWSDRIFSALKACEVLLVLLSARSIQRSWVNFEAGGVFLSGRSVIPLCIGNMSKGALAKEPYGSLQAMSLADEPEELLKRLHELLPGTQSPPGLARRIVRQLRKDEEAKTFIQKVAAGAGDTYTRLRAALEGWQDDPLT